MDIDDGIKSAFNSFHPKSGSFFGIRNEKFAPLIKLCDQKTMNHWHDFCKWFYCQNVLEGVDGFEPDFDFEISPMMRFAMDCCDECIEKYTINHLQYYSCEICEDGYIDDEDCEDCNGLGYDSKLLDDRCIEIINSIDTSVFLELSKITSGDFTDE